ncbi:MAG: SWIM zinc finger family protein [Elusimicrobiota bacterium]
MINFSDTIKSIQDRTDPKVFTRGESYYQSGQVRHRIKTENGFKATVVGTRQYQVIVDNVRVSCNCPYDRGGYCKHIVATFLAWLKEPESFQSEENIKEKFAHYSKEELVDILYDLYEVQPDVIELYALKDQYEPEKIVKKVFEDSTPPGGITDREMLLKLNIIESRAKRLIKSGDYDLARRTYFALIMGCLEYAEEYGSDEIFPSGLISEYGEKYTDIVLKDKNWKKKKQVILNEISKMESHELADHEGLYFDEIRDRFS